MSKIRGKGLLGVKVGMTSIFGENGDQIPVTVVRAGPNTILGVNALGDGNGTNLRVGFGEKREKLVNKPEMGVFKKANVAPLRWVREFRVSEQDAEGMEVGTKLGAALFQVGQFLDVCGTSKGKGFAGVMKRHNMAGQGARGSHGVHEFHRHVGSIGQRKTPGRVFPGKRMPGHMGVDRVTVRNLQVIGLDETQNLLLIKGAIPGHNEGLLILRPAVKAPRAKSAEAAKKPVNPMKASKGRG
ncbi:50S ribosomal protein L3 [Vulgatibacter incomptus]|uniref:Large ribosomal subunit protein uL3 n=1 Tax=Vulgatibacter incomptus TaxID=1391653 RepID=A0A0K1PBR0_9BACT|nr:50S ribosomal protein L3 [Vulgatibacter incomptus]AKU90559.1 LSU ribosomal protein L3p (L3e) [Vulgatibacter incomptus]